MTKISNLPRRVHGLPSRPDPYFLMGVVSVFLLAMIYVYQTRLRQPTTPAALPAALFAAVETGGPPLVIGQPSSPIRVVEVMEYQCPACAEAHKKNWPILLKFASQGRVLFRAENVPLPAHANAVPAGVFAACMAAVSPERFWDYHALLLARQDEWAEKYEVNPAFTNLAHRAGGDTTAIRTCVGQRGEQIAATLRGRFRTYAEAGFSSVPVWSVNGRIVPWGQVESEIAAAEQALRRDGR